MADEGQPLAGDSGTPDIAFDVLSHPLRRAVLSDLRTHDHPRTIVDIAKTLTAHQQDVRVDELSFPDVDRYLTVLQHVHIPKLREADAIRVDEDGNTVALTARGERLCACVDYVVDQLARQRFSSQPN